jgi:hypothetical protein
VTLKVQAIDERIFEALGIANRGSSWQGVLGTVVTPVISIPLHTQQSEVLGFNDAEVDNDRCLVRGVNLGAVAGQFAAIQCMNPAGSGVVFYLDLVRISTGATPDLVAYGRHDTQLTTDGGLMFNKHFGGAASVVRVRSMHNAAQQITETHGVIQTLANAEPPPLELDPPYRLDEGRGFVVVGGVVNQVLRATFHGRAYTA